MSRGPLRCCWRRLLPRGDPPAARSSHTVNAVGGRICVFGGEDSPRNAFDRFLHILERDGSWKQSKGSMPGKPLLGHGSASLGPQLFIFGGREGGPNTFSGAAGESDVFYSVNVDSECWTELEPISLTRPEPRSFHAMCAAGGPEDGHVFLFGGCGASGRLNDLWRYSVQERAWHCLHPGGSSDIAPVPRGGASLVASNDGKRLILLFGFSGEQRGDIAIFDIGRLRWELLQREEQKGDVPAPRSVFSAAVVQTEAAPAEAVIFGGERVASDQGHAGAGSFVADLHALDMEALSWRSLRVEGESPEPRGWAGMASLGPRSTVLFGGLNAQNARLGDAWELEFLS
eukprot:CAMPEP_0179101652 /NCGR_PEP_ID=MMETSP0796-20121207/47009_1 /TAXON_ID=73915 /ORGANISM="Pyrodinium bahamense, Strain pbaha01" /LENGTH=343 /DNA_ID=CAMNT_0020799507 /DNA_START=78 /DNA_END=1109 /DNA_ORIENTATION=+